MSQRIYLLPTFAFTLVFCLTCSSILKIEELCSSETSVNFQRATRRCITEDRILDNQVVKNNGLRRRQRDFDILLSEQFCLLGVWRHVVRSKSQRTTRHQNFPYPPLWEPHSDSCCTFSSTSAGHWNYPLGKQWAAVSTHVTWTIMPPQKCRNCRLSSSHLLKDTLAGCRVPVGREQCSQRTNFSG
jgi:hypothetical protein